MSIKLDRSVTIGIAAHDGARITEFCLDTLFAAAQGNFELILVDDYSTDDTLQLFLSVGRSRPNTHVYSFPRNLEYSQSVNAILSAANGEKIFFVSNDILVTPTWISRLLEDLSRPSAGIVRGVSNYVDNMRGSHNFLNRGFALENNDELFALAEALPQILSGRDLQVDPYLLGDAFAVSREVIDVIGTFDTRFTGYLSDMDFGVRARAAGFTLALDQKAFCYHLEGGNIAHLPETEKKARFDARLKKARSAYLQFLEKYDIDAIEHPPEGGLINEVDLERAVGLAERSAKVGQTKVLPIDYSRYLVSP